VVPDVEDDDAVLVLVAELASLVLAVVCADVVGAPPAPPAPVVSLSPHATVSATQQTKERGRTQAVMVER